MSLRRLFPGLIAVVGLAVAGLPEATAQVPNPNFSIHIDSVISDCDKGFRGAERLHIQMVVHVVNNGCPGTDVTIAYDSPILYHQGVDRTSEFDIQENPSAPNPDVLSLSGIQAVFDYYVMVMPNTTLGTYTLDGKVCGAAEMPCNTHLTCSWPAVQTDTWTIYESIKANVVEERYSGGIGALGTVQEYGRALGFGDIDNSPGIDVVVGAPKTLLLNPPRDSAGIAFFHERLPGTSCTDFSYDSSVPFAGGGSFARVGHAVAVVDIDADGHDDVLVGAPWADLFGGGPHSGVVYLYYGPDFSSMDPLVDPQGGVSGAEFGSSLAVGDFDGNGYRDVAIGSPGEGYVFSGPGEVHLVLSDGTRYGRGWALVESPRTSCVAAFGYSLATGPAGGPGDDLVVGSPAPVIGGTCAPLVYLFTDPTSATPTVLPIPDPMPNSVYWGYAVAMGDVDGVGANNIAVGDPVAGPHPNVHWRVMIFDVGGAWYGPLEDPDYPTSSNTVSSAGMALAMADIDNDGHPDLLVGAGGTNPCGSLRAGEAFAFTDFDSGQPTMRYFFDPNPFAPPEAEAHLGLSIVGGELDTNCVGDEVIIGAPFAANVSPIEGKITIMAGER
jgi:hypothetical protein